MPFRPAKSRSGQAFGVTRLAVLASASALSLTSLRAADTEIDVNASATDLTVAASYTPPTTPSAATDVTFTASTTYATPAGFTIGSSIAFGSLNDLNATPLTITNSGTLTLGGTGDSVTGSNSTDLLYIATGANLTVNGGTIALAQAGNFDIVGAATVSSALSGTAALTVNGGGTLTLSGTNTAFSGGVTATAGTIKLGSASALGTGTFTGSGVTTDLNGQTLSNALVSGGNGDNFTNSSATTANVTTGFNPTAAGGVVISDFTINGTGNINWSGSIARTNGGGEVTKSGTNTLTLSGVGTGYTNLAYIVNGGTLAFNMPTGSTFAQYNGFGSINGIQDAANVAGAEVTGVTNTIAASINNNSGAGGTFTQSGAGTTILTGTNTYTGATTISAGTLQIGSGGTTGTLGTGALTNNGAFIINRSNAVAQGTDLSSAAITGTGSLTQAGGGTTTLSGANTYSGGTTLTNGTLQLGSSTVGTPGTVGSNGSLTSGPLGTGLVAVTGGSSSTLDLNGQTFGNRFYNGDNNFTITNTSASTATVTGATDGSANGNVISNFTVGGSAGTITWSGQISRTNGTFNLTKTGSDTVNFTGTAANAGVGTLTINAGVVGLGMAAPAAAFGNEVIVAGGTLMFRPDLGSVTSTSGWNGQLNSDIQLNTGTVDLYGSQEPNSRMQQFFGTGGTLTNTSATAAVLGIAARSSNAYNFAGTVQNGTGTVSIDFTSSGTTGSGRINIFSGTNTYSGTTTISYGTYELGSALASQNSTLIVNAANGLGTNSTYSLTTTNPLAFASGIGTFTIGGLSGAGNIALTDIGRTATGATATAATVTLQIGSSLATNAAPAAYSGVISDGSVAGGTVTKIGSSTEIFTGAETYTGATTISAGTLQLGSGGTTGTLSTSSAIVDNGNLAINRSNAVTQGTDFSAAAITGSGTLTQAGAGTTTLNAANTYSGGTMVSAGAISTTGNTAAAYGTGTVSVGSAGTLNFTVPSGTTNITYANNFVFAGGTVNSYDGYVHLGTSTSTIAINGATAFNRQYGRTSKGLFLDGILSGTGTLALGGISNGFAESGGIDITNNSNTYSGTINANNNANSGLVLVDGGTTALQFATVNLLGGTNATDTNTTTGLAFASGATAYTLGALGGATNVTLANLASPAVAVTLTAGGNNASTSYTGVLSGTGGLTKAGTGTMTLGGASTYTGATAVTGGTLVLGVTNTLATTSGITVGSGATLSLAAANALATPGATTSTTAGSPVSVAGQVSISLGGGTLLRNGTGISLGSQSGTAGTVGIGMLTLTAASTLNFGTTGVGTLNFNGFADAGNSLLTVTNYTHTTSGTGVDGTDDRLVFNQNMSSFLTDFSINGVTPSQIALGNGEYELVATAVPEPSTWVMGLLTLGAVGFRLRRRIGNLFAGRWAA